MIVAMNLLTRMRACVYSVIINFLFKSVKFMRSRRKISKQIRKTSAISHLVPLTQSNRSDFSIIIVTFEARFFEFTLPLITTLRSVTDIPIFVIVNGNFKKGFSNYNLQIFLEKLLVFSNIYPTVFSNFRGCAELWNTGIVNADSEYNLILNDDIHVFPKQFNAFISTLCELLQNHHLVRINRSFSHFGITRQCIQDVGFFDEHFLGMGEEDRDYIFRYETCFKKKHLNLTTEVFLNISDESRDEAVTRVQSDDYTRKYSMFNSKIFQEFYEPDSNSTITGVYDVPMRRKTDFIDPRPLWKFRISNRDKLSE
jgi:hypothetical protein